MRVFLTALAVRVLQCVVGTAAAMSSPFTIFAIYLNF